MNRLTIIIVALFLVMITFMAGVVYALNMASASGSVPVSATSWLAATVAGSGDGNPHAPFSYTLNPGNSRRAFAYVKNFGSENISSVTLIASGGPANRTITVTACSGSWTGPNACSGTTTTLFSGPANSASGSLGSLPVGGMVHIRVSCPQNVSGQITTVAI